MKKIVMSIAAVAAMLLVASCGNKTANADSETKEASDGTTEATTSAKAQEKTTYEQFTVEKYGVTVDVPTGMRRTDDPVMDNGACWTLVPEDDDDFPIYAAMAIGVYESFYGEYTDERIKEEFENDMLFASTISDSASRNKVVRNAIKKNLDLMGMTLDKKQFRKYLMLINISLTNRGFIIY